MFIHWQPSLETGQTLIDTEHRVLVFLFRKLHVAIRTGSPHVELSFIIREVTRFVDFHFVSEENLMRETHYPQLLVHQAQHADLLAQLGVFASRVERRREAPEDLLYFVNHWLMEHIARHDQHVARHAHDAVARPVAERDYSEFMLSVGAQHPSTTNL